MRPRTQLRSSNTSETSQCDPTLRPRCLDRRHLWICPGMASWTGRSLTARHRSESPRGLRFRRAHRPSPYTPSLTVIGISSLKRLLATTTLICPTRSPPTFHHRLLCSQVRAATTATSAAAPQPGTQNRLDLALTAETRPRLPCPRSLLVLWHPCDCLLQGRSRTAQLTPDHPSPAGEPEVHRTRSVMPALIVKAWPQSGSLRTRLPPHPRFAPLQPENRTPNSWPLSPLLHRHEGLWISTAGINRLMRFTHTRPEVRPSRSAQRPVLLRRHQKRLRAGLPRH